MHQQVQKTLELIAVNIICLVLLGTATLVAGCANSELESQVNPVGSTGIDYGMPERLGRQVAPTPSAPWHSPDLTQLHECAQVSRAFTH